MKKNSVILLLMVSSMLLLLAFQVLWVMNSYENAFYNFRRDTNLLFRNTVMNMRLNSFVNNMVELKADSVTTKEAGIQETVSSRVMIYEFDTLKIRKRSPGKTVNQKNLQVFIESNGKKKQLDASQLRIPRDTLKTWLHEPTYIVKLASDSISLDSLRKHYRAALLQSKVDAQFEVRHADPDPRFEMRGRDPIRDLAMDDERPIGFQGEIQKPKLMLSIYSDTIHSDPVRYSPFQLYVAQIFDVRRIILREIAPQILFSIFLLCMISAAFITMYRNLRSQQKLMEIKNDFISNVTHELKTPVATVSVALEALKNFNALESPERTAEYLDIAQNELKRLTLMTDKILKTSVFETRGVDLKFDVVELDKLAEQVISSLRLLLERRKMQVDYHKTGVDFTLQGAEEHLTNVLYNLVDNAVKYSPDGSAIDVTLKEDELTITLTVQDKGMGIPKEYHDKIFEKFFRVPSGDLHNIKGYGLGLSYVAGVVRSHHGEIDLESEPGNGSKFIVTLPKKHVDKSTLR